MLLTGVLVAAVEQLPLHHGVEGEGGPGQQVAPRLATHHHHARGGEHRGAGRAWGITLALALALMIRNIGISAIMQCPHKFILTMSPVKLWTALATARLEEARQVYCPSHVLAGVTCHRCRDTRPGPGLVTVRLGAVVRSWG